MKNLLIASLIFLLTANLTFAVPNYTGKKPTVYDTSYNIQLRKQLEDNYHKKCNKKIDDTHYVDVCPMNAYYYEVTVPYDLNSKSYDELPIVSN